MLEIRNLTKIYSGKKGVQVKALDDVSVVFPEKGMVFLLGKSGSGKSTLLNVAGGLDKPDKGEVIVKGKSSKDFSGSDFDSYRNTFIGFVFQEYNILNEFTIEQNIALALQLQNKPNNKKAVNALLEQVDLAGYGKRKPNTLSGGQKQRVAIARALIKEPEIIMADEPTGALDSATGKQVLDTLKKLSETKLVIVVSHDREFAEFYADRIIEMKDGKVLSDVSKVQYAAAGLDGNALSAQSGVESPFGGAKEPNVSVISENTISIKKGGDLSDDEVRKIAALLRKQSGEIIITADQSDLPNVKRACKISEQGSKTGFKETEAVESESYDGKKTKFIKSRLPMGHAFKMGASGLKSKPIRLIFTILLSVAAFVLFGLVSTFMLYDSDYSVSEAMKEANNPAITLSKSYDYRVKYYDVDYNTGSKKFSSDYTAERNTRFGVSELSAKNKEGLSFAGVFIFSEDSSNFDHSVELNLVKGGGFDPVSIKEDARNYYHLTSAMGFTDCGREYLEQQGYALIRGSYPADKTEIALPRYLAELFVQSRNSTLSSVEELVGKQLNLNWQSMTVRVTVSGIYDVGEVPAKYLKLKDGSMQNGNEVEALQEKFDDYLNNSFQRVIFVTPDFYEAYKGSVSSTSYHETPQADNYEWFMLSDVPFSPESSIYNCSGSYYTDKTLALYGAGRFTFYTLEGEPVTRANTKDALYLSYSNYLQIIYRKVNDYYDRLSSLMDLVPAAAEEYRSSAFVDKMNGTEEERNRAKKDFLARWQEEIAYRAYLFYAVENLYNTGRGEYSSGSFYETYQRLASSRYQWSDARATEADWAAARTVVKNDFESDYPQAVYGCVLQVLRDAFGYYDKISENDWEVVNVLNNGEASGEAFASYKAAIDAFMTKEGIGLITSSDPFALGEDVFSVSDLTYYYIDRLNERGELSVLGYFKVAGSNWPNASYYLPTSFLRDHADYVAREGYFSMSEEVTSYVAPADAKYNYLISPTDNSAAQIKAAIKSDGAVHYAVASKVYMELQMFVSYIDELGTIFLYIGLGIGLLAAFLLFNFISVSISAKRRDIGILRAVGARGSDVFKIFYAEAFLIALICFVLATVGSFVLCFFLNKSLVELTSVTLLHFGPINIALIFGISIVVSFVATFLPVYLASRKSPVESIRAL